MHQPVAQLSWVQFSRDTIDAGRRQPLQVFLTQSGIDNMEASRRTRASLMNGRIPISSSSCERMRRHALRAKHGASKANRLDALARSFPGKLGFHQ